jgi:L-alanine-DL-glutamate epimerase-like enolase superfamily enzyme
MVSQLRRACSIPIAAGENVSTLMDFERLMAAGAVDFVQPSPAKMGVINELCKVFPTAAVHNITVMPHCSSGHLDCLGRPAFSFQTSGAGDVTVANRSATLSPSKRQSTNP